MLITLDLRRDKHSRAQKLKSIKQLNGNNHAELSFPYLRHFYLKKLLLAQFVQNKLESGAFLGIDFQYPIILSLFKLSYNLIETSKKERAVSSQSADSNLSGSGNESDGNEGIQLVENENSQKEHIIKSISNKKVINEFETEMITIKGTYFGILGLGTNYLHFKTKILKAGKEYELGATACNIKNATFRKTWKIASITEVVVKRYNLIRQAVEIYLCDSKPLFFLFFRRMYRNQFLRILHERKCEKIIFVKKPEAYFNECQFTEKWIKGEYSNFEYLLLLNKYGGRTFNDIGQYPVFPWILKDYNCSILYLQDQNAYRPLERTIAGISKIKQDEADQKLNLLVREVAAKEAFQFGSHYLPGRVVLGYLYRMEPYSSILISYEHGQDAPDRMFHSLVCSWANINHNTAENNEIIPEFFTCPWIFGNFNDYFLGIKREVDYSLGIQIQKLKNVLVDQVVLPKWAKNSHHFIQMNALALESSYVSYNLNNWIDLIFGVKQQDQKSYNLFNQICDESIYGRGVKLFNESQIALVEEFGSIPIKLFHSSHPTRNLEFLKAKREQNIFNYQENLYLLKQIAKFNEPVTYIKLHERKLFILLNSNLLYRSKDDFTNTGTLLFEPKPIILFPRIKNYNTTLKHYQYDAQKALAFGFQNNSLITSGHFDKTCKLIKIATGEILEHLSCHTVI